LTWIVTRNGDTVSSVSMGAKDHFASDADFKGSTYNVLVEWESGEITYKPLDMIGKDDPVMCAEYAHRMNLLGTPGW
jgi:hypothetical protein